MLRLSIQAATVGGYRNVAGGQTPKTQPRSPPLRLSTTPEQVSVLTGNASRGREKLSQAAFRELQPAPARAASRYQTERAEAFADDPYRRLPRKRCRHWVDRVPAVGPAELSVRDLR